jgi:effector-binding domain-containing protein
MSEVTVTTVSPDRTCVVRRATSWDEFPRVWRPCLDQVYAFLDSAGLRGSQRWNNVMLYLDDEVNVEVGVLISQPFSPGDGVVESSLPGGSVASVVHRGGYDELGSAHDAVQAFCRDRGLDQAGPRWEVYGHPDPDQVEVEVYYLLAG